MCDDEDIGFEGDFDDSPEEVGDIDSRLIDYFLDAWKGNISINLQFYYLQVSYPILKQPNFLSAKLWN